MSRLEVTVVVDGYSRNDEMVGPQTIVLETDGTIVVARKPYSEGGHIALNPEGWHWIALQATKLVADARFAFSKYETVE